MLFEHLSYLLVGMNYCRLGNLSRNIFILRAVALLLVLSKYLFYIFILVVRHSNYLLFLNFHMSNFKFYFLVLCCFDASARITAAAVDTLKELT